MDDSNGWSRFLSRQMGAAPLKFVTGFRHSLKAGVSCGVHTHHALEMVYHPLGRGCTRLPQRKLEVPFQEQSIIIYAPHEMHDQILDEEGEDLCVHIQLPGKRGLFPTGGLHIPRVETPSLLEDMRVLSQGYTRLSTIEQNILNLRATAALFSLLNIHGESSQREAAPAAERYVLKAEQYIREHLLEIQSVTQIAKQVDISPHYLRHLFKALRGKSLIRYVNEIRIDRAKSLLSHSRLPMKQIAMLCGFRDEYYFSATFRILTHSAPGRFRKRQG